MSTDPTDAQLADKLAIEELIARYNHSLDGGDFATWVACWTDDAVLDGLGQLLVGRAAIQAFADGYTEGYGRFLGGGRHFTTNIVSVIDGDVATSESNVIVLAAGPNAPSIAMAGHYWDTLRRVDGHWRFAGRKMRMLTPPS